MKSEMIYCEQFTTRIITHEGLTEHVVAGSAHVVRFDEELELSYNMVSENSTVI